MSFEIKSLNPERYRQETRRVAFFVIGCFFIQAMLFATLSVQLFGTPGTDNFRFNLAGVVVGVISTVLLVRFQFWDKPWMASAVYGWRLKRHLMRLTNVMHHIKAGVIKEDENALNALRFYHVGLIQMCQLDNNPTGVSHLVHEIDQHKERMEALGLMSEQTRWNEQWIEAVRRFKA